MAWTSTSWISNQWKYDVFLSFRGADTRTGFVGHLYDALIRSQIDAFIDYELRGEDETSPVLLNRIEESCISVIIFSENYAYSPRCLDELAKIAACRETKGQMVMPIFYRIDPTDVQELRGRYGDAFAKHEAESGGCLGKVESWRNAVMETSVLKGWDSNNVKTESKLIEEIVDDILNKLSHLAASDLDDGGFVGINARIKEVESLLCMGSSDVCFIGIWGMGGVGKTTIAAALFNQISFQFEGQCFYSNVREELEKRTPVRVRDEILSKVLGQENLAVGTPDMLPGFVRNRLQRKRILIVLDDVSSSQHLKTLVGEHSLYAQGSRIIITSRDKQVLKNVCDRIYEVKRLIYPEALHLFRLHAFKQNQPSEEHMELSRKLVNYTKGIPLALKVLGCNLYDKGVKEWESELGKLEGYPNMEVQKILRISYNGLDWNEQCIFLDIACFFKGQDKNRVEAILDGCGFYASSGITYLNDKSLINISKNKLGMHDLLQQMGQSIVRQECVKKPWKRSRLWIPNDICRVFGKNKETDNIEGIFLDTSKIEEIELSRTTFARMCNLRLLQFYNPCSEDVTEKIKVRLPKGLERLSEELRFLYWEQYPLKSLPSKFCPNNLVELHMPHSQVKQLWSGVQHFGNLNCIDLRHSTNLIRLPDFFEVPNLEVLNLEGCTSLVEFPSTIQFHMKIKHLTLEDCKNLRSFPNCFHLTNLEVLILHRCPKITEFSEIPRNIMELNLNETAVEQLQNLDVIIPECRISYENKLMYLLLDHCTDLGSVPSWIHFMNLETLSIQGCSNITELPDFPVNLKKLFLDGTGIEEVPTSIRHLCRLELLDLGSCARLESLPSCIGELKCLKKLRLYECLKLASLPDSICNLKSLEKLEILRCANLDRLPENLGNLESLQDLSISRSGIKKLPSSVNHLLQLKDFGWGGCRGCILPSFASWSCLEKLYLHDCGLLEIPDSLSSLVSLTLLNLSGNSIQTIPASIEQLSKLSTLSLKDCKRLESLPKLPSSLEYLVAHNCTSLRLVSRIFTGGYKGANEFFNFGNCFNLEQKACSEILADAQWKFESMTLFIQNYYEEDDHDEKEETDASFGSDEEQEYSDVEEDSVEAKSEVELASLGASFCVPVSDIPFWFNHQNTGSSLTITLPGSSNSEFLGCALCAVIVCNEFYKSKGFDIRCDCHFTTNSGSYIDLECYYLSDRFTPDLDNGHAFLQSKHMFIWFQSNFYEALYRFDKATFEFYLVDLNKNRIRGCKVIKCGVSLLLSENKCRIRESIRDEGVSEIINGVDEVICCNEQDLDHGCKFDGDQSIQNSTTCWNWLTYLWMKCF